MAIEDDYKEMVNTKIRSLDEMVKVQLNAIDKALVIKTAELERRLELLNELRNEVVSDRTQFVRREAYDIIVDTIQKSIRGVEKRITVIETRSVVWTAAIGVIFVIVQIGMRFIK